MLHVSYGIAILENILAIFGHRKTFRDDEHIIILIGKAEPMQYISTLPNTYKMYKKFEFEKGSRDRNKK